MIIGQKDEVKIPEGESVILDVHPLAAASFENDYNRSSIMWFRFASMIEDNSTIRGISISSDRQRLLISTLFIASGAEDGTEAVYRCKVCGNGHPDNSSLECKEFKSHLRALSIVYMFSYICLYSFELIPCCRHIYTQSNLFTPMLLVPLLYVLLYSQVAV